MTTMGRLRLSGSTRDGVVDGVVAVSLSALALTALWHAYGGVSFLAIGVFGAAAGVAIVAVTIRFRFPPLVVAFALIVGFFLLAGPAVPGAALARLLPTPSSVVAAGRALVQVWVDSLTTSPPLGTDGGLGMLPYICGFSAGSIGMLLARGTDRALAPALPSAVAMLVGFTFGTSEPVSVVLDGALFVVVALGWGAVRANRSRRSADGTVHWHRLGAGVAMLGVVSLIGLVFGTHLPFVDPTARFALREQVEPPFDPRNEPSPLGAFRRYRLEERAGEVLFRVTGWPEGARLRLATMDTYDGVVWVVGGPTAPGSGRFERVGEAILPTPPGEAASIDTEVVSDGSDVWLPTVGTTRSVRFRGDRGASLASSFRYNRDTASGAVPIRLQQGDRYSLDARLSAVPERGQLATRGVANAGSLPPIPDLPDELRQRASQFVSGATTPYEKAAMLEEAFRAGYYSDGGTETRGTTSESPPGHSLVRIQQFLDNKVGLVGNAEQYAATMALFARSVDLPARVVMGFAPKGSGTVEVHADDVDAWVEIAFDGVGWVPFYPTPDKERRPPDAPQPQPRQTELNQQEPPPPTYLPMPDISQELAESPVPQASPASGPLASVLRFLAEVAVVAGIPLSVVIGIAVVIMGAKWMRARRRRTNGSPAKRLNGAWLETCDRARDLGASVPGRLTRREALSVVDERLPGAGDLAEQIDAAMFGPQPIAEETLQDVWDRLEEISAAALDRLPFGRRFLARVSLASLRPGRSRRRPSLATESDLPAPSGVASVAAAGGKGAGLVGDTARPVEELV